MPNSFRNISNSKTLPWNNTESPIGIITTSSCQLKCWIPIHKLVKIELLLSMVTYHSDWLCYLGYVSDLLALDRVRKITGDRLPLIYPGKDHQKLQQIHSEGRNGITITDLKGLWETQLVRGEERRILIEEK